MVLLLLADNVQIIMCDVFEERAGAASTGKFKNYDAQEQKAGFSYSYSE